MLEDEEDIKGPPNTDEILQQLKLMIESIEGLPPHAMASYITHYDFVAALGLLVMLYESKYRAIHE